MRVMLIDDEPLALEGLKLLIDWQAEGFTVCAECQSAVQALALLPSAKPDLIVTDIRMPEMSGLDLVDAARQAGFDGQFIIVSGYSDFYYAKKALQLGVAGYLLKPLEPADATAVLSHVRKKLIDREAAANLRMQTLQRTIGSLLADGKAPDEPLPHAAGWMLATWGAPLSYQHLQAISALFTGDEATIHIVEDKEFLVLQLPNAGEMPELSHVKELLKPLGRSLRTGGPVSSPGELPALRKQLSDQLDSQCRKVLPDLVDKLVRTIALRQTDECKQHCRELNAFCAVCGTHAATYARRQLLSACSGLLSGRSAALQTFLKSQDAGFEELSALAIQLLEPRQERISDRMEHYAAEHLDEAISLADVAAALTYNTTYLGRKFIQERGIGFRDFVTQLRMEKSATLLKTTQRSVNDISRAVGYDYYKRFLKHFKHRYGVSPEQYRKQK